MAISTDIVFHGLYVEDVYVRVERFNATSKTDFRAYISVYADSTEAASGQPLEGQVVDFTMDISEDALPLHEQAYAAVKVLYPDYTDV